MTHRQPTYGSGKETSGRRAPTRSVPPGTREANDRQQPDSARPEPARFGLNHDCRLVDAYHKGVHFVEVRGRLDWATAATFRDLMAKDSTHELVIDLSEAITDSAGTELLIGCVARAHQQRQRVLIVAPDPTQYEVFGAVGLDSAAPVVSSQSEAIRWFAQHLPT